MPASLSAARDRSARHNREKEYFWNRSTRALAGNKDIPVSCKLLGPKSITPVFDLFMFEQRAIILPLPMSQQSGPEDSAADLLDPYDKLISLEIMGNEVSVPEKNRLLRCFQYLSINTISYGDFCWNGECTNCQVWYHMKGQSEQNDKPALSCRLECEEGMVITRLSRFIELEGITK